VTFFGKTLLMCLFQAVIRWSLPRFRYDQLMKLGWLVLLPASLVNVMVTGVVILLLQEAGTKVDATLVLAGHLTQAVVALAGLYGVVRFFLWLGGSRDKDKTLVGSSAKFANAAGGTVEGAMQA
jgi:NADH-quinone oxidoreductase subunit H